MIIPTIYKNKSVKLEVISLSYIMKQNTLDSISAYNWYALF